MHARVLKRTGAAIVVVALLSTVIAVVPSGAASTTLLAKPVFATNLSATTPIVRLVFNHPVSAKELPPIKSAPAMRFTWQQIGAREVQAVPANVFVPDDRYVLEVPVHFHCHATCVAFGYQRHVATASGSMLWAQELLAKLAYLPVFFKPSTAKGGPDAFVPGTFTWKFPALPSTYKSQWVLGSYSTIMQGSIMRFQSEMDLNVTGVLNAPTWAALFRAVLAKQLSSTPYDYVYVSQTLPETLTLYRNGHKIFTTLVNTGVAAAPTESGTYPVYLRFLVTTMSGTEPDGKPYSDPGIPWVSYFHGGDALHGFLRSSYGWPQSLGCVEMPYPSAQFVYPWTPIGTLVTVN